jgi:hypothetical protein
MTPTTIFLSDIDGVLIQPNGYFHAFEDAVNIFTSRMGMPGFSPNYYEYSLFEAQGITCEWDMIPISLVFLFEEYLERFPEITLPGTFEEASQVVCKKPLTQRIAYSDYICQLKALMQSGIAPAKAVLSAAQSGMPPEFLPRMAGTELIKNLLGNTRDFCRCETSALFETLVIGSDLFNLSFGCSIGIKAESYLKKFDQINLNSSISERIKQYKKSGRLAIATYTARPNLPPPGYTKSQNGFLPEAELAAMLLGWDDIPFIGYGSLTALAIEKDITEEELIKPRPVQPLTALFAARGLDVWNALLTAWDVYNGEKKLIPETDVIHIHAFEDARNGLIAVKTMGDLLRHQGFALEIYLWGVATNPHKVQSLKEVGAQVFGDVNQAYEKAMEIENLVG